jgi:hypothetical protein
MMELKRRGHVVAVQNSFPVFYHGELIGNLVPKVVACFAETHVTQMIGYLNITGLDLTNFKNARLEWKRVLRSQEREEKLQPDLHV